MILRPATVADLTCLVNVQQEGALAALAHIFSQDTTPFPRKDISARWEKELTDPTTQVLVAEEESRIRGFAATRSDQLLHFGTAVDSWGTGLASAMHDAVLTRWGNAEVTHVWLWVFQENQRARRFYTKHGWNQTTKSRTATLRRTR